METTKTNQTRYVSMAQQRNHTIPTSCSISPTIPGVCYLCAQEDCFACGRLWNKQCLVFSAASRLSNVATLLLLSKVEMVCLAHQQATLHQYTTLTPQSSTRIFTHDVTHSTYKIIAMCIDCTTVLWANDTLIHQVGV